MRLGWLHAVLFPAGTLLVLWKTRSLSKTLLWLTLEVVARLFYFIVIWNPPMASLVMGADPKALSSAARTCAYNTQHAAPWTEASTNALVPTGEYYAAYHSHPIHLLVRVRESLIKAGCKHFIYLAGDSSLDNKHWFFNPFISKVAQIGDDSIFAPAVNGYQQVLDPPRMVKDVSFWLNYEMSKRVGEAKVCTLTSAVEESTVEDRAQGLLLPDVFIREHITEDDFLVLSVGGNDVALSPTLRTTFNMLLLTSSPAALIKSGLAPGFGYFFKFFHDRIEQLVKQLVAKRKPQVVIVCMIYYLDEQPGGSWADFTLGAMGYDKNPSKLQLIIKTLFEKIAEVGFNVPGVKTVVPFPLFSVLDGKNHSDYVQRVEPSVEGGHKMAKAFADELLGRSSLSQSRL